MGPRRARSVSPGRRCSRPADRGDIVLGWLTQIIVLLTVLGLVVVEGLSLVSTRISGKDVAAAVALAGSDAYSHKKSVKVALLAAEAEASSLDAEVVDGSFLVAPDGRVTVSVRQTAKTVLLYRTDRTKKWAFVDSRGTARALDN